MKIYDRVYRRVYDKRNTFVWCATRSVVCSAKPTVPTTVPLRSRCRRIQDRLSQLDHGVPRVSHGIPVTPWYDCDMYLRFESIQRDFSEFAATHLNVLNATLPHHNKNRYGYPPRPAVSSCAKNRTSLQIGYEAFQLFDGPRSMRVTGAPLARGDAPGASLSWQLFSTRGGQIGGACGPNITLTTDRDRLWWGETRTRRAQRKRARMNRGRAKHAHDMCRVASHGLMERRAAPACSYPPRLLGLTAQRKYSSLVMGSSSCGARLAKGRISLVPGEGANPHPVTSFVSEFQSIRLDHVIWAAVPPTSDGIRTVGCSLQKLFRMRGNSMRFARRWHRLQGPPRHRTAQYALRRMLAVPDADVRVLQRLMAPQCIQRGDHRQAQGKSHRELT